MGWEQNRDWYPGQRLSQVAGAGHHVVRAAALHLDSLQEVLTSILVCMGTPNPCTAGESPYLGLKVASTADNLIKHCQVLAPKPILFKDFHPLLKITPCS